MSPEMRPQSFGTFEKRARARCVGQGSGIINFARVGSKRTKTGLMTMSKTKITATTTITTSNNNYKDKDVHWVFKETKFKLYFVKHLQIHPRTHVVALSWQNEPWISGNVYDMALNNYGLHLEVRSINQEILLNQCFHSKTMLSLF